MASPVEAIQKYSSAAEELANNTVAQDTFTLLAQLTGLVLEAENASALYNKNKKDLQNPRLAEWRLATQTTANLKEAADAAAVEHNFSSILGVKSQSCLFTIPEEPRIEDPLNQDKGSHTVFATDSEIKPAKRKREEDEVVGRSSKKMRG